MVPELDIAPRLKGRATKVVSVRYVRDLQPGDLALLASERGIAAAPIKRLRDRHHALARCIAQGMSAADASAVTGYELATISMLKSDPSFRELVANYHRVEDSVMADFMQRTTTLTLTAMNNLQEKLEDDENPVPVSMELEIFKAGADRIGHAPVQKNQNINVNLGTGDRLSAARARLRALAAPTDAEFTEVAGYPPPDD